MDSWINDEVLLREQPQGHINMDCYSRLQVLQNEAKFSLMISMHENSRAKIPRNDGRKSGGYLGDLRHVGRA